jgi:hypothetical protein
MTYSSIGVVKRGTQVNQYMYPLTDLEGRIVPEKWDNGMQNSVTATSYSEKFMAEGVSELIERQYHRKLRMDTYITDSRVTFSCTNYNRDGLDIWLLFGIPQLIWRAASRRGKVLAGHIRYEWISEIYYSNKTGILSDETVRLCYEDSDSTIWAVDITLNKNIDSAFIANNILQRACRYRLAMQDEKSPELMEFLTTYSKGGEIPPSNDSKKQMSGVLFPNYYLAPTGENKRPILTGVVGAGEYKTGPETVSAAPIPVPATPPAPKQPPAPGPPPASAPPPAPQQPLAPMDFCNQCGWKNVNQYNFCSRCGNRLM